MKNHIKDSTALLRKVGESLNKVGPQSYSEILERHENSIDFITDGELKRLEGLKFKVSDEIFIVLKGEAYIRDKEELGIIVNLGVVTSLSDFTRTSADGLNEYPSRFAAKFRFDGTRSQYWDMKISSLHREVISTVNNLKRKYAPSKYLEKIIGPGPMPKLQILDSVSRYILTNNLKLQNGDIKIDGLLKPFYPKDTFTVCEWTFFDTLRENTLISEFQLNQFLHFNSHPPVSNRFHKWRTVNKSITTGSSEYIDGPAI